MTLDALIKKTEEADFAILVATADDTVNFRGEDMAAVRDNIIFEFGLFVGALGRERVYWLSVGDAKLPSDLAGLTRLTYQPTPDKNIRAGLNNAALQVEEVMEQLGPRARGSQSDLLANVSSLAEDFAKEALTNLPPREVLATQALSQAALAPGTGTRAPVPNPLATATAEQALNSLENEIALLCENAKEQGWAVPKNNPTTLRLKSPKGGEFTLQRKRPAGTRIELRNFVAQLRANGLRVNHVLQGAVEDSPY